MSDDSAPDGSEETSSSVRDKFSKSLGDLGDKAKDTAKKSVQAVGEKTKEVASRGVQKVSEKAEEIITASMAAEATSKGSADPPRESPKQPGRFTKMGQNMENTGRNMERQVETWIGWFWSTIAYGMLIMISFVISSSDARFSLLPIILLIGFPFFLYYAIVNSIPEVKIGSRVIFSRKNLSVRRQLSFTAQVARTFSREMIRNSPIGAFFIFSFLLLLVVVLILPFIN